MVTNTTATFLAIADLVERGSLGTCGWMLSMLLTGLCSGLYLISRPRISDATARRIALLTIYAVSGLIMSHCSMNVLADHDTVAGLFM